MRSATSRSCAVANALQRIVTGSPLHREFRQPNRCFNPRPHAQVDSRKPGCFNPCPARGRTTGLGDRVDGCSPVSIHAPRGGERNIAIVIVCPTGFQSTPPPVVVSAPTVVFQSTPPRGGERCGARSGRFSDRFNPRPRAGANAGPWRRTHAARVSIHAPARGRTAMPATVPSSYHVSIHAPARGRTPRCTPRPRFSTRFNPRPRAGANLFEQWTAFYLAGFNPRPRAGANGRGTIPTGSTASFNPRPRAGANPDEFDAYCKRHKFQSTPPRGGERTVTSSFLPLPPFQSTPPRGGERWAGNHHRRNHHVSIHAPARGRTMGK